MDPAQGAAALEGRQVAADGLGGHAERVGQGRDLDPAGLARLAHDALLTLRYDLLARLHADGLLQDLQPVLNCLEGTAVRRRDAIDDVRLAAQDGVAAKAFIERPADRGELSGDGGSKRAGGHVELAVLLLHLRCQPQQRVFGCL